MLLWIPTQEINKKMEEKKHAHGQDVWRHDLSPLHTGDNICRYRYFFPGYWGVNINLNFETSCRRRQNMSLTLK